MLRYLAVLAVMLACFTGDVSAETDEEFQIMQKQLHDLSTAMKIQASKIIDLEEQLKAALGSSETDGKLAIGENAFQVEDVVQNITIEERVALLEVQVADLDQDVNFLFDETVIQDERILTLEQDTDQIEDEVESLQVSTLELDFRVSVLEENGGSDGNSSISELEGRVETLEGTAADHETRITSNEGDIEDLEGSSADHETRLTAAEENIQGLQMTDLNHEARISALEESGGGGGGSHNGTIAFHAVLTVYNTIPDESNVEFNLVLLNEGNGYDSTTGVFTVPPGGDGVYYFSTHLLLQPGEYAYFDMRLNSNVMCTALGDHDTLDNDFAPATCSVVVSVVEGDEVKLVLRFSTDNTPLHDNTIHYNSGFSGFRI